MPHPPKLKIVGWWVALGLPAAIFLIVYPHYVMQHTFFWMCLVTLPISIIPRSGKPFPFLLCCVLLALVSLLLPTTIGLYTYVCSMTLFLLQQRFGSVHVIGLIHAFLASPFFSYLRSLISFPIRIQLSLAVSHLLRWTGVENQTAGNVITIDGQEFLVDQACSGMYLLGYGILFGTLILALRIRKQPMMLTTLLGYFGLLVLLIVLGNLTRIYVLVVFHIAATHWMHEVVGLLLFAGQILIPFYTIVHWKRSRKNVPPTHHGKPSMFPIARYGALLTVLIFMIVVKTAADQEVEKVRLGQFPGYEVTHPKRDVIQLTRPGSLIYLKKPVAAHRAEHNPLICWTGSGYAFQQVETWEMEEHRVNLAVLKKGNETLYSSWWFESPYSQTASQWEWRWRSLTEQESFFLVNLTCSSEAQLKQHVKNLMAEPIIAQHLMTKP